MRDFQAKQGYLVKLLKRRQMKGARESRSLDGSIRYDRKPVLMLDSPLSEETFPNV